MSRSWRNNSTLNKKFKDVYKIVLLGDVSVGKTSIANRLIHNKFDPIQDTTIGACFLAYNVMLSDNTMIKLHFWDTSGQERFRSLVPLYYKDTHVALLVYDVSNPNIENVEYWINEYLNSNKTLYDNIILIGNKIDSIKDEDKLNEVYKDIQRLNTVHKFPHILVSAKTGESLYKIIDEITKYVSKVPLYREKLMERYEIEVESDTYLGSSRKYVYHTYRRFCNIL